MCSWVCADACMQICKDRSDNLHGMIWELLRTHICMYLRTRGAKGIFQYSGCMCEWGTIIFSVWCDARHLGGRLEEGGGVGGMAWLLCKLDAHMRCWTCVIVFNWKLGYLTATDVCIGECLSSHSISQKNSKAYM